MLKSKGTNVGIYFLTGVTRTKFNEMRNKVIKRFGLEKYDIPTYHYMTMHRPKFDSEIIEISKNYAIITRESKLKNEKQKDLIETKKNKITKEYYCKLFISLIDCLIKLFEKCERKFCDIDFWNRTSDCPGIDNIVIILMSADGEAHQVLKEGDSNVISLNLQIINAQLLKEGYTSMQSIHILTPMQVIGAEKPELCCTMFESFLFEIK